MWLRSAISCWQITAWNMKRWLLFSKVFYMINKILKASLVYLEIWKFSSRDQLDISARSCTILYLLCYCHVYLKTLIVNQMSALSAGGLGEAEKHKHPTGYPVCTQQDPMTRCACKGCPLPPPKIIKSYFKLLLWKSRKTKHTLNVWHCLGTWVKMTWTSTKIGKV